MNDGSEVRRTGNSRCQGPVSGPLAVLVLVCMAVSTSLVSGAPNAMRSFDRRVERHVVVSRDDDLYEAFPDLVLLPSGKLLCLYRQSDQHAAKAARVVLMESEDRGRTWTNRRVVLDGINPRWNLPRITRLSNGKLVINGDRAYNNWLTWSEDDGITWSPLQKVPFRGACPDRIVELSDGTLLSNVERELQGSQLRVRRPRAQNLYQYRSTDGGATWTEAGLIFEDIAFGGSGEGATVELPGGVLVCHVRNSAGFGHPSPRVISLDNGSTWSRPLLSATYGGMHRAGLLQDGRMLVTYRQMSGNSSLYAWCGDPLEPEGFRPSSRWGSDDCSHLVDAALRIHTEGKAGEVPPVYFVPAPEYHDSIWTIEAELKVIRNDTGLACTINVPDAGEVLFFPGHIEVFHQHETRFELDATKYHSYRIVRDETFLSVFVDGVRRIRTGKLLRSGNARWRHNEEGSWFRRPWGTDRAAFGTTFRAFSHMDYDKWKGSTWRWDNFERAAQVGRGESHWRSVSVNVENRNLPDVTWSWDATSGAYPDQYQRDFIVEVHHDPHADYGGSAWVQFPDGEILVAYYTAEETRHQRPYLMGCYLKPSDFRAPVPAPQARTPAAVRAQAERLRGAN